MKNIKKVLEKDVQKVILEYLSLRKIFHWRNNTGAFATQHNGKTGFYHFGTPGSHDIFALKNGTLYGIEVKKPGGKLSENQIVFHGEFEKAGGINIVASSVQDVISYGL